MHYFLSPSLSFSQNIFPLFPIGLHLYLQGIYRVNGVKTRVEKLCQAFENGKELVELSQCSPHDISNVLKLYLRQVPCSCFSLHI